jgi:hypothetical protein
MILMLYFLNRDEVFPLVEKFIEKSNEHSVIRYLNFVDSSNQIEIDTIR